MRNSWLTFEKNAVFARSICASASARRFSRLVRAGVVQAGRELPDEELEEAPRCVVERTVRVDRGDEGPAGRA